ncbi:DUF4251 domain-containing protein [Puteibacter caeruleilacunae]|nr:DUF4251 domain-containing protein [Puteibacter caeruleilacunae]
MVVARIIRKYMLLLVLSVFVLPLTAGNNNDQKKNREQQKEERIKKRQERKAERAAYDREMNERALEALKNSDFVLEAHTVYNRWGDSFHVQDHLNFISLTEEEAVLQLAFCGYGGPNGLGGITIAGRPTKVEMKQDKKGNTRYKMVVMGPFLNVEVLLTLSGSSNRADAWVTHNTRGGRLHFSGYLKQTGDSDYYVSGLKY